MSLEDVSKNQENKTTKTTELSRPFDIAQEPPSTLSTSSRAVTIKVAELCRSHLHNNFVLNFHIPNNSYIIKEKRRQIYE